MNPPLQRYPLAVRLLLMFSLFLFNIGVVSFIGLSIAQKLFDLENADQVLSGKFSNPGDIDAFLFIQGFSSIGGFILTAMMFAVLEAGEFKKYLGLRRWPSLKFVLLAILSVFVAQFFIGFLVEVNQQITLPDNLQFIADYQKKTEVVINAIMGFTDVGHLIWVSIVVALIPAIGEEFFFRGLLLGDLLKGKLNPVFAIIITGLIFSISHFEYDNMLAIWALGSFLGYLYYISGSLWLPIAAHFANNFLSVLVKYLFNIGIVSKDLVDAKAPMYLTIGSTALFAGLVYLFFKWRKPNLIEIFSSPSNITENKEA